LLVLTKSISNVWHSCDSNAKACLSVATVGDDIKRRGEHADKEGDNIIDEHESGDVLGASSGEFQSAIRFGVSANSSGANRSCVAIRDGVNANRAGECADPAGVGLEPFDVNFNLANDDKGVAGEVGSGAEDAVRADRGEPFPRANTKRALKPFSGSASSDRNGLGDDPCAEKSDRGGCAVVDGAMEVEAAGLDLKEGRDPPASLVVIFYKRKKHIHREWLDMRSRSGLSSFYQPPADTHFYIYTWRLRVSGCGEVETAHPW
jgi:hypothetical protein